MKLSISSVLLRYIIPWSFTIFALWYVQRGIDWPQFWGCLSQASIGELAVPVLLTCLSYVLRAQRWRGLFPRNLLCLSESLRITILGFFMNNVLPARAGEFVRAHYGSKATGESRSLVLATIASERLLDGVTLSVFFALFAPAVHSEYGNRLLLVAFAFGAAAAGVVITLSQRKLLLRIIDGVARKYASERGSYVVSKIHAFLDGLTPLYSLKLLPGIIGWSVVIWGLELAVFGTVAWAYGVNLSVAVVVLFMVTSNFSSLVPAAPGGIGIVEAVSTAVLVSVGVDKEQALAMALTQHVIQYIVVGIPGALALIASKKQLPTT